MANMLQYSCLENPPDREAWQATVFRVAKSCTRPKWPCVHRHKTFFACGSSVPVTVENEENEGGAAAWLAGTHVVPSVQVHGLPPLQKLWPSQSLFPHLLQLAIKRPLWPVFLGSSTFSGTWRAPSPGVLLCCLAGQAHRGASPGWGPNL